MIICLILLVGCGLLYKSFIEVGEDNIQLDSTIWSNASFDIDYMGKGLIGYDTSNNYEWGKYTVVKYLETTKRSLFIPFNYGGTPSHSNDDIILFDKIIRTFISDTSIDAQSITLPNNKNKIDNKYIDSISKHYNVARIEGESRFSKISFKVSNSFIGSNRNNNSRIDTLNHGFATIIWSNDTDDIPMVTAYESLFPSCIPNNYDRVVSKYIEHEIEVPIFGKKPSFFRKEDLSKRIINIAYPDGLDTLVLEFNGPINVVAADVFPDSTTMSAMYYYPTHRFNYYFRGKTKIYLEFPKQEHVQEARILIVTTFAISVLCTLIINCFFAIIKYANRRKKTNEMKDMSIPCYGSFSDCSECSMYNTCSYRPVNRTYYRTHRKPLSSHQEETGSKSN